MSDSEEGRGAASRTAAEVDLSDLERELEAKFEQKADAMMAAMMGKFTDMMKAKSFSDGGGLEESGGDGGGADRGEGDFSPQIPIAVGPNVTTARGHAGGGETGGFIPQGEIAATNGGYYGGGGGVLAGNGGVRLKTPQFQGGAEGIRPGMEERSVICSDISGREPDVSGYGTIAGCGE